MITLTREQAECVLKELRQLTYHCDVQDTAIASIMAQLKVEEVKDAYHGGRVHREADEARMATATDEEKKTGFYCRSWDQLSDAEKLEHSMVVKGNGWFHGKGLPPADLPVADLKFAVYRDDITQIEYQWHDSQWH
jgi:hypothetical protein